MSDNHEDGHPDAIVAKEALAPLNGDIFEALEYGIERARDHFEDAPLDPWLFPHIVRFRTLERLTVLSGVGGYSVAKNPMSGIEIECAGYQVRVFKKCGSDSELLYPPGHSQGRQDFYSQQLTIPGTEYLVLIPNYPNVAYVWEAHADSLELWLACPDGFDGIWRPGRVRWSVAIDHPALAMTPDQDFLSDADDDDLPIEHDVTGSDDPDSEV